MTYRRYTAEELQTLFRAIDNRLDSRAELILIGGAAALLAYYLCREGFNAKDATTLSKLSAD